ncbi:prenyltransferase [Halobacillus karajensis]|uniref:1,4-dihydroxy-2-naphthoate octaprenyltransferase n=1 Tax=Halobacillus karajensis TaxID=195088 RepID=A0A059NZ08_9BACI|nr:prenyltransferase [Halobacillus karajensis]CDQ18968.1 1,4-dihydroxy-2-naphthoate octaprenyltransferase [Halobacillus karajensis]CDQ22958.1 1,4-dihydroxy-2-naphthoate octaprenyltransferase [Halobacillus karajensis]CDQ26441.1 1,4-dihydroxy-2-naphthoate octaprenyltransferase [Halobacillus karajensis]
MFSQALSTIKTGWLLLRSVAVISSSVATIVSTVLPLYLYFPISGNQLMITFTLLIIGAFIIHGGLTHLLNDYIDDQSGTDAHSPAILSGGSRVIQTGLMSSQMMWRVGKGLIILLLMTTAALAVFEFYKLSILLAIGLWGAISYSLPPLRLSYRPFVGEWFATFPSVLFLGLAGAWLTFDTLPEWAVQNAAINAIFCIAWVMVHHIPDREADQQAHPIKQTSVVWAANKFGPAFSRLPALFYFAITGLCAFWLGVERIWAAFGMVVIVAIAIRFIVKMDVNDPQQVSNYEKIILVLAMINAVWLGIFI